MKARDNLQDKIAQEIYDGLKAGKAKERLSFYLWAPFSSLLYVSAWHSSIPMVKHLVHVTWPQAEDNFPFYGSLISPLYNDMADRRLRLVRKGPLDGVLAVRKSEEVTKIEFRNDSVGYFSRHGAPDYLDGMLVILRRIGYAPYDIMGTASLTKISIQNLPKTWLQPTSDAWNYVQFTVPPVQDRFYLLFGKLVITLSSGHSFDITELVQGATKQGSLQPAGENYQYLITSFPVDLSRFQKWEYAVQDKIYSLFNGWAPRLSIVILLVSLLLTVLASLMPSSVHRVSTFPFLERRLAVLMVVFVIAARIAFYAVMDGTIFPVYYDRHLFSADILVVAALLLIGWELSSDFWGRWRARRG